ncbi:hypothetical protein FTX61_10335 [Nitriliruptoraceae bacterium ZYF776]|nr:hypothetical protein [Profundirhabdus halotolerans]
MARAGSWSDAGTLAMAPSASRVHLAVEVVRGALEGPCALADGASGHRLLSGRPGCGVGLGLSGRPGLPPRPPGPDADVPAPHRRPPPPRDDATTRPREERPCAASAVNCGWTAPRRTSARSPA